MDEKKYIKIIEKMNADYQDLLISNNYIAGKNLNRTKELIKKGKILTLLNKTKNRIIYKKINCFSNRPNDFKTNNNHTENNDKKIVIYSCITGNYDNIVEPLFKIDNVDYFLFTDNEKVNGKIWNKEPIEEKILQSNNILTNRYLKFHPNKLFKDKYDYSIYIDGNIQVIGDITELIYSINPKTGLSIHRHAERDSIYNEGRFCILNKKGNKQYIKEQLKKYKMEGMPEHYGLLECSIIVTDLKNENAKIIYDNFWNEFIASKTMRDQLIFPYILWKMNYKIDDVGSLGNNEYRDPKFKFIKHNN